MQLGLSYEQTFASEQNGVSLATSGASGSFMHPGIVLQFFGLVSLPLAQQRNSIVGRQRLRLGTGIIWTPKAQRNVGRARIRVVDGSLSTTTGR
jgi:hypothetical protein